MAVYFQNIPDDHFNIHSDFIVKESKTMNVVVGIFLLLFSIAAFYMSVWIGGIVFLFALGALTKSTKNTAIMKINKTGFYYYEELITDRDHFISEEFIDDVPLPNRFSTGTSDKFYLMLKYYKDGQPGYFGRKIRFTDSQDKSEEEIIAAIKFYYRNSEKITR